MGSMGGVLIGNHQFGTGLVNKFLGNAPEHHFLGGKRIGNEFLRKSLRYQK
jgi:hypothetical protein